MNTEIVSLVSTHLSQISYSTETQFMKNYLGHIKGPYYRKYTQDEMKKVYHASLQ